MSQPNILPFSSQIVLSHDTVRNLCEQYAQKKTEIARLEEELELLSEPIKQALMEVPEIVHAGARFTLGKRDTWRYSESTQAAAATLRATEKLEQANGTAQVVKTTFYLKMERRD